MARLAALLPSSPSWLPTQCQRDGGLAQAQSVSVRCSAHTQPACGVSARWWCPSLRASPGLDGVALVSAELPPGLRLSARRQVAEKRASLGAVVVLHAPDTARHFLSLGKDRGRPRARVAQDARGWLAATDAYRRRGQRASTAPHHLRKGKRAQRCTTGGKVSAKDSSVPRRGLASGWGSERWRAHAKRRGFGACQRPRVAETEARVSEEELSRHF